MDEWISTLYHYLFIYVFILSLSRSQFKHKFVLER